MQLTCQFLCSWHPDLNLTLSDGAKIAKKKKKKGRGFYDLAQDCYKSRVKYKHLSLKFTWRALREVNHFILFSKVLKCPESKIIAFWTALGYSPMWFDTIDSEQQISAKFSIEEKKRKKKKKETQQQTRQQINKTWSYIYKLWKQIVNIKPWQQLFFSLSLCVSFTGLHKPMVRQVFVRNIRVGTELLFFYFRKQQLFIPIHCTLCFFIIPQDTFCVNGPQWVRNDKKVSK